MMARRAGPRRAGARDKPGRALKAENFFQKPATKPSDDERLLPKGAKAALDAPVGSEALAAFSAVASENSPHADEALYWKAYALNKMGRRADSPRHAGPVAQSVC